MILLAGAADESKALSNLQNEAVFAEMDAEAGFKGWLYRTLNVTGKAKKQNEKIFKKIGESNKDIMRIQGVRINAKWMRETLAFNTTDYLKEVECPVLATTGDKDVQVPPEHTERIAELVKGEAEWHIIPGMNHIFRKYEGEHTWLGLIKEYKAQLDQPIDQDLFDLMGDGWESRVFRLNAIHPIEDNNIQWKLLPETALVPEAASLYLSGEFICHEGVGDCNHSLFRSSI